MEDIDYGALFGLDEGANEQEVADPADGQAGEAQGEEAQEPAAPAVEEEVKEQGGTDNTPAAETNVSETSESVAGGQAQQTPEERAKFAAARRKAEAERDAAIEQARKDAQAEAQRVINEAFANSGLTNPYTKQPITSKAEYDEYRTRYDAEQKNRILKKSGMSDDEFAQFVANLPEVKAAKEAQETAQAAARQVQEQQAKIRIDEQIKEINAIDPTIKDLKDLTGAENYQQIYALVKRGNSLVDAYKLANYDRLTGSAAAAARQAATNAARGKDHLTPTTTRGAGAVSVPADIRDAYKAFNPNATDAEIQQHYQKYIKH